MANAIMPTVFSSGVRRLHTLSGWALGALNDPDLLTNMMNGNAVNGGTEVARSA